MRGCLKLFLTLLLFVGFVNFMISVVSPLPVGLVSAIGVLIVLASTLLTYGTMLFLEWLYSE